MVLVYTQIEKRASLKTKEELAILVLATEVRRPREHACSVFLNLQLPRVKQQVTKIVNC